MAKPSNKKDIMKLTDMMADKFLRSFHQQAR
jgi:hypothetical protein